MKEESGSSRASVGARRSRTGGLRQSIFVALIGMTAAVAVVMGISGVLNYRSSMATLQAESGSAMERAVVNQAGEQGQALAVYFASNLVNSLYLRDFDAVRALTESAGEQQGIGRAVSFDSNRAVISDVGIQRRETHLA